MTRYRLRFICGHIVLGLICQYLINTLVFLNTAYPLILQIFHSHFLSKNIINTICGEKNIKLYNKCLNEVQRTFFYFKRTNSLKDLYLHGSKDGPLSHKESNMVVLIQ